MFNEGKNGPGLQRSLFTASFFLAFLLFSSSPLAQGPTVPGPLRPGSDEEEEEITTVRVDALVEAGLSPGRNLVRANTWSPVSVTLTNYGIEVEGHVEIGFFHRSGLPRDPRRYRRKYRFPISLPKKIKKEDPPVKRYTIPVFFEEDDGEIWVSLSVPGRGWLGGGAYLELGRVPLNLLEKEQTLILAISDLPGDHNHLARSLHGLPLCRVVDTRPDQLPDSWAAYTGADAVIIDTRGIGEIGAPALEALRQYVSAGGRLIVCGGVAHAGLQEDPWPDLLPVRVTGFEMLETPQSLDERFTSSEGLEGSLPVSTAVNERGKMLLAEGDIPLIVRGNYGLGSICYVAFNLNSTTIRQWPGRRALARLLFTVDRDPMMLERSDANSEQHIELSVLTGQLVDLPSRTALGGFLALYILAAVPVNFLILRRTGRREFVWLTLPALAALFSGAIFTYNHLTRAQRMSFSAYTILEAESGSSFARGRTYWSVYSPTRTTFGTWFNHPLTFPSEPLAGDRENLSIDAEPIEFAWGRELRISHLPIRHQSNRMFASSGLYDLSGFFASDLILDGQGRISGTVANQTSLDLYQCYLVREGQGISLGRLAPGASAEVRLNADEDLRAAVDPGSLSIDVDPVNPKTDEASLWVPNQAWSLGFPFVREKAGLHLVGLSLTSPVYPAGRADVSTVSEGTFVVVSLPVRVGEKDGGEDRVFPFVSRRMCERETSIPGREAVLPVTLYFGEWATFAFKPAGMDLQTARVTGCRVKTSIRRISSGRGVPLNRDGDGRTREFLVQVYNQRMHSWEDIPAADNPASLEPLEDYVDPDAPELFVRLAVPESADADLEFHIENVEVSFFAVSGGEEEAT